MAAANAASSPGATGESIDKAAIAAFEQMLPTAVKAAPYEAAPYHLGPLMVSKDKDVRQHSLAVIRQCCDQFQPLILADVFKSTWQALADNG